MKKYKLSLYFGYHDSSVTISDDEQILLHLEGERYFRKKHIHVDVNQMVELINIALHYQNIDIDDVNELLLARWNNQFDKGKLTINGKTFDQILTGHHENHIGSLIPAGIEEKCLIICADGGSEDGTTKFYLKEGNSYKLLKDYNDYLITGKFYGTITQMIIDPNVGRAHDTHPGKTMGLAALGKYSEKYWNLLDKHWVIINTLHKDGVDNLRREFRISDDYTKPWEDKNRRDLAFTAQKYWEDHFIEEILKFSHLSTNIALVGGCALNVLLNSHIEKLNIFKNIYLTPVSGDNGQSIGALLYKYPHLKCEYPFLGRGYGEIDAETFNTNTLIEDLLSHKIIAWYQGRSEIGARALGHRSFIAIPDSLEIKDRLSIEVKRREPYRPVAPIVLEDNLDEYFDTQVSSPYMTFSPLANQYVKEKALAIVHYDGTSRIQTLAEITNPILHRAIKGVGQATGVNIIMNTSLNVNAEPIVDTPEDALKNFYSSKADILYINGKRYVR